MQIGIRLHDSIEVPIEERLAAIRKQGFTCTHMALSKTKGLPSAIEAFTPGYAAYLRKVFAQANIDIAVLGCYLNLGNPNQEQLRATQKTYREHLRFASMIGAGVVGTETGAPNETYTYEKEACHSQAALDRFIENLKPVVEDAERFGTILAIEPVYTHIVYNAERAREVLDRIASPNLKIIFDAVNVLHPDNLDRRDEVIGDMIRLLGEEIAIIHLKDYRLIDGKMQSMACGLGEMDYSQILTFAQEHKPFIQATLEDTKPENAEAARAFIEAHCG